jgi:hypothetical protein
VEAGGPPPPAKRMSQPGAARATRPPPRKPATPPPEDDEAEEAAEAERRRNKWKSSFRAAEGGQSAVVTSNQMPKLAGPQGMVPPEQLLDDAKDFVVGLPTADKIAFAGAAIVVLVSFMPWKETASDGEVLGLMSNGIVAFLAALATMGVLVIRVRRIMPRLNPLAPWLAQLASAIFGIIWCLIFIKISWDGRRVDSPIGHYTMAISTPSFGVVLGLIGGLVALGGTLLGLKEKAM